MNLIEQIENMKKIAEMLSKHSHPKVSHEDELEVIPLKTRIVTIDGTDVILNYSISDFGKYISYSLQIRSIYSPFISFNIVCRLAKLFLGTTNLCYTDFYKNNKKIYCWTLRIQDGNRLVPNNAKLINFEDLEYNVLNSSSVNLY